jgi:hypothetical protein
MERTGKEAIVISRHSHVRSEGNCDNYVRIASAVETDSNWGHLEYK